jgi:hypothetical protein
MKEYEEFDGHTEGFLNATIDLARLLSDAVLNEQSHRAVSIAAQLSQHVEAIRRQQQAFAAKDIVDSVYSQEYLQQAQQALHGDDVFDGAGEKVGTYL